MQQNWRRKERRVDHVDLNEGARIRHEDSFEKKVRFCSLCVTVKSFFFQLESFNADLVFPRKTPEKASGFGSLLKEVNANDHQQIAAAAGPTQSNTDQTRRQSFETSARRAFECVNEQK